MNFKNENLIKYQRQILHQNIGEEGQFKLFDAKVLVIGAGGLGSPAIYYLASAGVGNIGIVDFDKVEKTNLNRQFIHPHSRVGTEKVYSAKKTLFDYNPDINVVAYETKIDDENAEGIVSEFDVVLDCCDNFKAKYAINKGCVKSATALVHAGILEYDAQVMFIIPGKSACYRCVFRDMPDDNDYLKENPKAVIGYTPGIAGAVMAGEAIKYILGDKNLLINTLLVMDTLKNDFRKTEVVRQKDCPDCGFLS
jgi:molybdopterin/thiamine biosynthesis adenylyltransferase